MQVQEKAKKALEIAYPGAHIVVSPIVFRDNEMLSAYELLVTYDDGRWVSFTNHLADAFFNLFGDDELGIQNLAKALRDRGRIQPPIYVESR